MINWEIVVITRNLVKLGLDQQTDLCFGRECTNIVFKKAPFCMLFGVWFVLRCMISFYLFLINWGHME
jgi:hypothetical protein